MVVSYLRIFAHNYVMSNMLSYHMSLSYEFGVVMSTTIFT
jgi:hypothetical protein